MLPQAALDRREFAAMLEQVRGVSPQKTLIDPQAS